MVGLRFFGVVSRPLTYRFLFGDKIDMDWMSVIFHITEIIGTFAFAVSGAMVFRNDPERTGKGQIGLRLLLPTAVIGVAEVGIVVSALIQNLIEFAVFHVCITPSFIR